MKCYALATRFNNEPIKWIIPGNRLNPTHFFAHQAIGKWQQEIMLFCDEIKSGSMHCIQKDSYFFYAKKLGTDYCIIALDSKLNEKQMNFLSFYLLRIGVDIEIVANDVEKYTNDHKIEEIKDQVAQTRRIMLENIEKVLQRGEGIEKLVVKTENLEQLSFQFKHESEKLNACWPRSCNII